MQREFQFTDTDFRSLGELIGKRTGIVVTDAKRDMIYGRIARRLRSLELSKFSQYIDYLHSKDGPDELEDFVNAVTTNLTHFFREPHHFEHILDDVIRPLVEDPSSPKKLRIWSAGCSAGMEAYSIAMMVRYLIPDNKQWDVKILATDIDTTMLDRGKRGVYDDEHVSKVPIKYRNKFTHKYGDKKAKQSEMADSIKNLVHFKHLNLMEKWPVKGPFDIIFCRNVMIYFDDPTCSTLFHKFAEVQGHGGWLYIGHSETMSGLCDKYELYERTIYRREVIL